MVQGTASSVGKSLVVYLVKPAGSVAAPAGDRVGASA